MSQPLIQVLHVPTDVELLAAVGRVVITHGHLNHVLIRTIKTFANMKIEEADYNLARVKMPKLRERIGKLAAEKMGEESEAFKTLMTLLAECEKVTEDRNRLVHDLWVSDWDHADPRLQGRDESVPLPTTAEINSLAKDIQALAKDINEGRLSGFIAEALAARDSRK
jgi:hypothetical protein